MSDEIRRTALRSSPKSPQTCRTRRPQSRRRPEASALSPQPRKGFWGKVDEWFGITRSGSNYRTEIVAGLTTFMAMVYILMVNAGMFQGVITGSDDPYGAAYIATAIGAIVGTLLMAFLAKMPLAPGFGYGNQRVHRVYPAQCFNGADLRQHDGIRTSGRRYFPASHGNGTQEEDFRGHSRGGAPRGARGHRRSSPS